MRARPLLSTPDSVAPRADAEAGEPDAPARPAHVAVRDAAALRAVLRREVNLCVLRRELPARRRDWFARVAETDFCAQARLDAERPDVARLVEGLPAGAARAWLAADIATLARTLGALARYRHIAATLAVVRSDSCRKFHVDRIGIRLLCTYAGPGTEWVPDDAVLRDALARPDAGPLEAANTAIVPDPTRVRRAGVGEVVLLKGEGWPGNEGRGIVHRSPPLEVQGLSRFVLTLDRYGAIDPARPLRMRASALRWTARVLASGWLALAERDAQRGDDGAEDADGEVGSATRGARRE